MTTIALFGAGGKMGVRLAKNLVGSSFELRHVEPSAMGRQRLKDSTGLDCVDADVALKGADVVILAVPDTLIGRLAAEISPQLAAGTMLMTLDAAAPFAGHLPLPFCGLAGRQCSATLDLINQGTQSQRFRDR